MQPRFETFQTCSFPFAQRERDQILFAVRREWVALVGREEFFDPQACSCKDVRSNAFDRWQASVDHRRGEVLLLAEQCASFFHLEEVTLEPYLCEHRSCQGFGTRIDAIDKSLCGGDRFGVDD